MVQNSFWRSPFSPPYLWDWKKGNHEQENEIRAAIERGERMRRDGRVYKLAVYRGGQVKNVVLTVAKDGQRLPAGNVYDRIKREKGEPPRWDEWRRAYVPEGNKIYAYKIGGDRDNAFDARRRVLVARERGGVWRSTAKGKQFWGTHVTTVQGAIPIFKNYRRANGTIVSYSGLENDGTGNMMPVDPDKLLELIRRLGEDVITRRGGPSTQLTVDDKLKDFRADLQKIRGGLGTPEEKKQWWIDALNHFIDELDPPENRDHLGNVKVVSFQYGDVETHYWSIDRGRSPEYSEQTITEGFDNGKLRFETLLDRKLYGVPLRPSNMYMAFDMSTEAWIDHGEGDCVPRQLALVIGPRDHVWKDGKATREFVPKYTVDKIKKKLAVFAELSKWEPGCSTPEDIANFC